MPMDREKHEELLNTLLDPDLETSKRTEILQELRVDYNNVLTNHAEMETNIEKLSKDNSDLIVSNSKLFRQMGVVGGEENKEEEKKEEFSETVTIEELEGGDY